MITLFDTAEAQREGEEKRSAATQADQDETQPRVTSSEVPVNAVEQPIGALIHSPFDPNPRTLDKAQNGDWLEHLQAVQVRAEHAAQGRRPEAVSLSRLGNVRVLRGVAMIAIWLVVAFLAGHFVERVVQRLLNATEVP